MDSFTIRANHVSFHHVPTQPLLDDLSFTARPGDFLAFTGPSGSGKTTLLHLLAGLLTPTSGSIEAGDGVLGTPQHSGRGISFQEARLLPHATVLDNITLAGRTRLRSPANNVTARYYLRELGLADWEDAYPADLSGGMAHRVSLARALYVGRRLLLLDEPFAHLDPATGDRVAAILHERLRAGVTIIAALHEAGRVADLATHTVNLTQKEPA